ncbi:hypothetical protein [Halomarina oriensis]|uniref:Uncharacterized protein n=1 Tax=Halomarina oriensis TaxID=671145 RepID=A0A6B0GJS5_9EURY|nr:hypothetical protein [Halomarina oriensis]MWG35176.1 hypothetical protein [Halomarina oriensis]
MSIDGPFAAEEDVDDIEALRRQLVELTQRVEDAERRAEQAERRADRAERAAHAHSAHLRAVLRKVQYNTSKPGRDTWNHVLGRLCDLDIEDYRQDPMQHLPAVERVGSAVQRHESVIEEQGRATPDPMAENWEKVLDVARNVSDQPDHVRGDGYTQLFWKDVQSATGHGDRHCKRLIEQLGETFEGADWIPYESPSPANNHSVVKKRLLIDLDVWPEEG